MGRRTKLLNKDVKDTILKYIRNGNYIKTACMASGISEATYYSWVQKAEHPNDNGNSVYAEFLKDLKKVEAENIAHNVENIQGASDNDHRNWMASAWLMERKYPAEFGKRLELGVGPSKVLLAIQEQALKVLEGKPQEQIGTSTLLTSGDE